MDKLLFAYIPIDLQYIIYSAVWRKRIQNKKVSTLILNDIKIKGSYLNVAERRLLNIFCLNLLSKYYLNNYPFVMNNTFINNVIRIIDNLRIQISYYQYEVINYWRTIVLAIERNQKTILTTFVEPTAGSKALAKIHNIAIYYKNDNVKNTHTKSSSNRLKSADVIMNDLIKDFKKTVWAKYKLIIKGTLFIQSKSMTLVDETVNYDQYKEDAIIHTFPFANMKKIIICSTVAYLEMRHNKTYIVVMPYDDCELFLTYLKKMRIYLDAYNVKLITSGKI